MIRPEAMELLKNKDPEAEELYRKIVVVRKATHEDENRMIQLNKIHCYNILSIPAEKIFKIERIKMESPVGYSKILESRFCDKCSEKVMATKTTIKEEKVLCVPCAKMPYNQLDWSGIVKIDPSNTRGKE